ncbi:MAG: hypothetical protein AAGA54_31725, partial [Myxococcota bacterium]
DEECKSGRRYGSNAPAEFAGVCVAHDGSTGVETTTGDGSTSDAVTSSTTTPDVSGTTSTSSGGDSSSSTGEPDPPTNVAFVTATTVALGEQVVADADALCAASAANAGLNGSFIAWVSTPETSARTRLEQSGARGWVRPDGRPIADRVADLLAGQIWYPPVLDATGTELRSVSVLTATLDSGEASVHSCGGWQVFDGEALFTVGAPGSTSPAWTERNNTSCEPDRPLHVYCFGTDHQTPVSFEPQPGRLAFVTANTIGANGFVGEGQPDGLAGMDLRCQQEASAAGHDGTFLALLGQDEAAAVQRFDLDGAAWVNALGVPIADTAAELAIREDFDTSLGFTAAGEVRGSAVWLGSNGVGAVGEGTCENWTTADPQLSSSISIAESSTQMLRGVAALCSGQRALLCFEQ